MAKNYGRILIVDDDAVNRALLAQVLEQESQVVVSAKDGQQALDIIRAQSFDLILLDIMMPLMNGHQVLHRLKQDSQLRDIPVIVISAVDDLENAVKCIHLGAEDYVPKPFNPVLLRARVRAFMEKKRLRDQEQTYLRQLRVERDQLRRLSLAVEQSSEGIAMFDLTGNVLFVNGAFAAMHGYTPDELVGQDISVLHTPDQMPGVRTANAQLQESGQFNGELWHRRRDGSLFPGSAHNSLLRDEQGGALGCISTLRDISGRIRSEEILRRRNAALALLNQLGQQLATILNVHRIVEQLPRSIVEIVDAQEAALWLWDEEQEGWLVCRAAFSHKTHHLCLPGLRLRPGQGIAGWVAQHGKSVIVPRASDDPRFFSGVDKQTDFETTSLLAAPLRIRFATIGVLQVVNKRYGEFDADDLALVQALATSAAVALDNAVLFEAQSQLSAELKARNEELDAFAHTVAHNLKGALNSISGFAMLAQESLEPMSAEQVMDCLLAIEQGGYEMASIIDEMLLLASMRQAAPIHALDMEQIVAQAQKRLAFVIQESQAEISLPALGAWPLALGYAPWIEEVWVNYLSNALKYGGRPPRIELGGTSLADGMARFWMRDNGAGISPEAQERLFTPFERLGQVQASGHGLGLSIVKRIVERLGGQVGVESQVGGGSVFSFTLPGQAL